MGLLPFLPQRRPPGSLARPACLARFTRPFLGILLLSVASPAERVAAAPPLANPSDYAARIARVGDGLENLRGEFTRLDMRITEIRMRLTQSEVALATGVNSAALLTRQLAELRAQATAANAPQRPGRPNNGQQIDNAITTLTNQLLVLNTRLAEERARQGTLAADLARSLQQQEALKRQAAKQLEEYWKVADPFGRYPADFQRAALAEFDKQLAANRDNLGALLARGICHRRLGQAADAEQDLTVVATADSPLAPLALVARGELYYAQGREKEGKADVAKATSLTRKKPDSRVVLYRGWLLCGQGKYGLAEVELTKALRLGGLDAEAHRLLALVGAFSATAGDHPMTPQEAVTHANRACQLTKNEDWLALEALAAAQAANSEPQAAQDAARQAAQLTTGELQERCEERVQFYEQGDQPRPDWPDPFRLTRIP